VVREGTDHEVRKIIAPDAKFPPDHVPLQVSRNKAAIAAVQTEGDAARGVAFVPLFGVLLGKVV